MKRERVVDLKKKLKKFIEKKMNRKWKFWMKKK